MTRAQRSKATSERMKAYHAARRAAKGNGEVKTAVAISTTPHDRLILRVDVSSFENLQKILPFAENVSILAVER